MNVFAALECEVGIMLRDMIRCWSAFIPSSVNSTPPKLLVKPSSLGHSMMHHLEWSTDPVPDRVGLETQSCLHVGIIGSAVRSRRFRVKS